MGKKILLADDSITIQKVIELTFSDEDFEVVTVGNGRLALEKLSDVRPDIVLCDIIMPEKDGYEVCEQIKKNPAFSHVPVLLLTGAFEPFDQERAARAGYDGSLAKPFEPETLIAKVRDLLARAPQRAQVAAPPPPPPVVPFARPTPAASAPTFVPAPPPPPPAPPTHSPSFISDEPFEMDEPEPVSVAPPPPPPPTPLREAPVPLAPMSDEESATLMAAPAVEMEEDEPQSTSTVMFKATDLPWNMAPAPVTAPTPSVKAPASPPAFVREPEQEFEPDALDAAEVVEETAVFEEVVEGDDLAFQTSGAAALDEPADSGGATVMFTSSRTLPPTPPPAPAEASATTASFSAREEEMTFEEPDLEPLSARDLEPEPAPEPEPEPVPVPEPVRLVPPPPVFVPEPVPPPPPPPPPAPRAITPPPMQAVRPPVPPLHPPPVAPPPIQPPPPPPAPPRVEPPVAQAPAVESFADVAPSVEETTVPPMASPVSEAAAVAVPVEMVEKIAQRVVAQISEKAVREIAWEVIPDLAEALIKQEIERLKAELQKI